MHLPSGTTSSGFPTKTLHKGIDTHNRYPLCTTPNVVCIFEAVLEPKDAEERTLHLRSLSPVQRNFRTLLTGPGVLKPPL
jgi:hypothetical protein